MTSGRTSALRTLTIRFNLDNDLPSGEKNIKRVTCNLKDYSSYMQLKIEANVMRMEARSSLPKREKYKSTLQRNTTLQVTLIRRSRREGSMPWSPKIIFSAATSICKGTSKPANATSLLHCTHYSRHCYLPCFTSLLADTKSQICHKTNFQQTPNTYLLLKTSIEAETDTSPPR